MAQAGISVSDSPYQLVPRTPAFQRRPFSLPARRLGTIAEYPSTPLAEVPSRVSVFATPSPLVNSKSVLRLKIFIKLQQSYFVLVIFKLAKYYYLSKLK